MEPGERMKQRLIEMMVGYDNANQFAACNGYSHGLVYNGLRGKWSDTLARQIKLNKYHPRPGIFIGCDEATRASFDNLRAPGESRGECLERLMSLECGELPY